MAEKFTAPRGTRDLHGNVAEAFHAIESTARACFASRGYSEIQTPLFESRRLFERSVGDETDIVKKELYAFRDKKDRELALRPEGTAGVVRAYVEHNLGAIAGVTKLWYAGPMFRYERPQGGRYRQFQQLGCEVFGSRNFLADVEVVDMAMRIVEQLGIASKLKINFIGCGTCRVKYAESVRQFFAAKQESLCPDCRIRLERNPLRILDCKVAGCRAARTGALAIDLCEDCSGSYAEIRTGLEAAGVGHEVDPSIVRGLDYYTGLVFEVVSDKLGAQDAVLGGGRYDALVEELGGASTPAVGFAIGMDRLAQLIIENGFGVNDHPFFYIIGLGDASRREAYSAVRRFEKMPLLTGRRIEPALADKSLKSHLKDADRLKAAYAVITGDREREAGIVLIREMGSGKQVEIAVRGVDDASLEAKLRNELSMEQTANVVPRSE
ncbi:MAG: histidine--tRNA ligase [Candidatus Hydrogenedentota bacterium]